jgi:hypothetical protein
LRPQAKIAVALWSGIALVVLGIIGIYWWADTPPMRPAGVTKDAIFFWGLPVGLPAPKRGDWVSCNFDPKLNQDVCRIVAMDGVLTYKGIFIPYLAKMPWHDDQLTIDSKLTNLAQERVGVNPTKPEFGERGISYVPLVYLRNGDVLIPELAYDEGAKILGELKTTNSPYAPAAKSAASSN